MILRYAAKQIYIDLQSKSNLFEKKYIGAYDELVECHIIQYCLKNKYILELFQFVQLHFQYLFPCQI